MDLSIKATSSNLLRRINFVGKDSSEAVLQTSVCKFTRIEFYSSAAHSRLHQNCKRRRNICCSIGTQYFPTQLMSFPLLNYLYVWGALTIPSNRDLLRHGCPLPDIRRKSHSINAKLLSSISSWNPTLYEGDPRNTLKSLYLTEVCQRNFHTLAQVLNAMCDPHHARQLLMTACRFIPTVMFFNIGVIKKLRHPKRINHHKIFPIFKHSDDQVYHLIKLSKAPHLVSLLHNKHSWLTLMTRFASFPIFFFWSTLAYRSNRQ